MNMETALTDEHYVQISINYADSSIAMLTRAQNALEELWDAGASYVPDSPLDGKFQRDMSFAQERLADAYATVEVVRQDLRKFLKEKRDSA